MLAPISKENLDNESLRNNHVRTVNIRVFHDKEIWRISVRISDRSKVTQNKIKFHQKLPPVGFELTTSRSSVSCSANCASKESVGDLWIELSFVSCITSHVGCWTLFFSGINRAWLYKGLSDLQRQPNSDLAQWQSMRLMIWRLWVQTLLGAFFDKFYFVLCNFRSVR